MDVEQYDGFDSALPVLSATFAWSALYFLLCLTRPQLSYEWHCRVLTMIHAVLVTLMAGWCAFVQGPWPFTDPGGPNTPLQHLTCTICFGYFLFDFAWCLVAKTEGAVMLCHHILCILGLTMTVYRGVYGTEMSATMIGTEITNPFLQMRWFLRESGYGDSNIAQIIDIMFVVLFGFFRIGLGTWLWVSYLNHPRPDFFGRLGGTGIYTISWIFWISIVKYAYRKYKKFYFEVRQQVQSVSKTTKPVMNGAVHHNGAAHMVNGKKID